MSISRWKIMACSLGLSLAGLAVIAGPMNNRLNAQYDPVGANRQGVSSSTPTDDPPAEPVAGKPVAVFLAQETLPPLIEIVMPNDVPAIPAPPSIALETVPEPTVALFGSEVLPMPREAGVPAISFETPAVPELGRSATQPPEPMLPGAASAHTPHPMHEVVLRNLPVEPLPEITVVPSPGIQRVIYPVKVSRPPPVPAAEEVTMTPVPPTTLPPEPVAQPLPPVVHGAPYEQPPQMPAPVVQQTSVATASKLKMLVRLNDGRPRFEIRSKESTELLFKVYGEKVEMQPAEQGKPSSMAGMCATGKVRFTGPGVEGTCDQLIVMSGTGEVMMKGNVTMKSKHGKAWSEVTAERMIYQISTEGLTTVSSGVRPASYSWRE